MKNLNMKMLMTNLVDIYMKFADMYGEREKDYKKECFGHMQDENSPEEKEDGEEEDYCIIETGFNIFFLIAQYIEFKGDVRKTLLWAALFMANLHSHILRLYGRGREEVIRCDQQVAVWNDLRLLQVDHRGHL